MQGREELVLKTRPDGPGAFLTAYVQAAAHRSDMYFRHIEEQPNLTYGDLIATIAYGPPGGSAVDVLSVEGDGSQATPSGVWKLKSTNGYEGEIRFPPDDVGAASIQEIMSAWLSYGWSESQQAEARALPAALEAFYYAWKAFAAEVSLSPDDERIGNALAEMANEVGKVDDPPRGPLRAALNWFAHKADVFTDELAKTAGKTAGAAAGVAVVVGGAAATGQLESLQKAIHAVRGLL